MLLVHVSKVLEGDFGFEVCCQIVGGGLRFKQPKMPSNHTHPETLQFSYRLAVDSSVLHYTVLANTPTQRNPKPTTQNPEP